MWRAEWRGGVLFSAAVRTEDIIAFARRDWEAIAELKRRHWAEETSRMTAAEALALGDELRRHALALHPEWPTAEHRREDLAVHIRVSESLRRVGPRRQ